MSKVFASLLLFAGVSSAQSEEECPSFLVLNVPNLAEDDQSAAQQYAICMSVPWLPLSAQSEAKISQCAASLPAVQSSKLQIAIKWVNHIAGNFAGCEMQLEIRNRA